MHHCIRAGFSSAIGYLLLSCITYHCIAAIAGRDAQVSEVQLHAAHAIAMAHMVNVCFMPSPKCEDWAPRLENRIMLINRALEPRLIRPCMPRNRKKAIHCRPEKLLMRSGSDNRAPNQGFACCSKQGRALHLASDVTRWRLCHSLPDCSWHHIGSGGGAMRLCPQTGLS